MALSEGHTAELGSATNTMNKPIFALLLAAVCISASVIGVIVTLRSVPKFQTSFGNVEAPINRFTNIGFVNVTTTSGQVAATSTGRRLLILQNIGPGPVYCAFNGAPGIDQQGFFILSSTTRRFPETDEPTYTGAVNCIASTTDRLLVNEAQY